jgi:hypothetical protein
MYQARFMVVRDAVDVVLRHLECLPTSDHTEHLHVGLQDCLSETEQWTASPPTVRELETVMKRVLSLYVAVTTLERHAEVTGSSLPC